MIYENMRYALCAYQMSIIVFVLLMANIEFMPIMRESKMITKKK